MKTTLLFFFLSLTFLAQGQTPDTAVIRIEVDSLIQLNRSLVGQQKYAEAHQVIHQAEEKCLVAFGEDTALYGTVVFNKGRTFNFQDDLKNAEFYYSLSKNIREKILGKDHPDYAWSLNNLGYVYRVMGQSEKAEAYYLEAKKIREKVLGKEHPNYVGSLNNLGRLYLAIGHYEKAEPLFLEVKMIQKSLLGEEHPDYAMNLVMLGILYSRMGQYEKAEPIYLEAKTIQKKVLGEQHPNYTGSLINLGMLYDNMGHYEAAESKFLEARSIFLTNEELQKHPFYSNCLLNLGVLYGAMGQYKKAEALYLEAKEIRAKIFGKEHFRYAETLANLGILYFDLGQYEKAEPFYLEAKTIFEKARDIVNYYFPISLNNLGTLYKAMGQYNKAETFYLEAKIIIEANEALLNHPSYMACQDNLGELYFDLGQYEKAESLFLKVREIRENVLGKKHPDYALSINNLGTLYRATGEGEKAEAYYLEANEIRNTLISKAARHLSESDLLSYTKTFINNQHRLLSFANSQRELAGTVYDNSLFYKGFLLSATQKVKRLAQTDSLSNDLFIQLKGYNRRLAKVYSEPIVNRNNTKIADLEEKANTIEKELTRSVAGFGEATQQVSWQELQATLKSGEAALEFIDYKFYNPELTDSTMYAAVLLRSGNQPPEFIPLFEEKSLDSLLSIHQERRSDYVNDLYSIEDRGAVAIATSNKTLYELIWQPLEKELEGITTIYFAPSGLLHRINLNAIPLDDEKSISDLYQTVQLNSTRSLVVNNVASTLNKEAILYGGIQFDQDSTAIANANTNYLDESLTSRGAFHFTSIDTTLRGGSWNYLKWTKTEVASIHPILVESEMNPVVFSDYSATEESFKAIGQKEASPRVLHLATHGFFFPDPKDTLQRNTFSDQDPVFKSSDNPMIRSGLILAGGNYVWQGNPPLKYMDDGILTAYEISQMDLSNTELVVLSACETGLGDIEGNEGVYGLQRAFKIAGAKYLIMSLWQVPDRPTKDFMVTFYRHWLEDEMTISDAFQKTQQEMKERFYDPYNWAGFVLVE